MLLCTFPLICTKGRGKTIILWIYPQLNNIHNQWSMICHCNYSTLSQFYPQLPSLITKYQIQLQFFKILLLCFMWNCYCSLLIRSYGKSPRHIPFSSWPPLFVEVFLTTQICYDITSRDSEHLFPLTQSGKVQPWICETWPFCDFIFPSWYCFLPTFEPTDWLTALT